METLTFNVAGSDGLSGLWMALHSGRRVLRHGFAWDIRNVTVDGSQATVTVSRDLTSFQPGISVEN